MLGHNNEAANWTVTCNVCAFYAPGTIGSAAIVLVFVLLATATAIEIGLAGVADFAITTYFAIGAYSNGVISAQWNLPLWLIMPISAAVAAAAAIAVATPLIRKHPAVFAGGTLCFALGASAVLNNWTATGGQSGLSFAAAADPAFYYDVLLAAVLIASAIAWHLKRNAVGTALRAARADEAACQSIGINPAALRVGVIALAGAMAGLAGSLYAATQGVVTPGEFDLGTTAALFVIVLGPAMINIYKNI